MYTIGLIFAFAGMLLIVAFCQLLIPVQMKETTGPFRGLKDLMSDTQVYLMILLLLKRSLMLIESFVLFNRICGTTYNIDQPLWVMNVVPTGQLDTLPVIFSRGLIGVYHDWCESFNTYPRTYDLHMSHLLGSLTNRCDIIEVAAEIDRLLRPGRSFVLKDTMEMIKKDALSS